MNYITDGGAEKPHKGRTGNLDISHSTKPLPFLGLQRERGGGMRTLGLESPRKN